MRRTLPLALGVLKIGAQIHGPKPQSQCHPESSSESTELGPLGMKFTLNLGVSPFHQATQAPNSQLRSNSFATTGTVIGVAAAAVAAASNGAVRSRKAAVAFWQQGKSMPEPHAAQFMIHKCGSP